MTSNHVSPIPPVRIENTNDMQAFNGLGLGFLWSCCSQHRSRTQVLGCRVRMCQACSTRASRGLEKALLAPAASVLLFLDAGREDLQQLTHERLHPSRSATVGVKSKPTIGPRAGAQISLESLLSVWNEVVVPCRQAGA